MSDWICYGGHGGFRPGKGDPLGFSREALLVRPAGAPYTGSVSD